VDLNTERGGKIEIKREDRQNKHKALEKKMRKKAMIADTTPLFSAQKNMLV